MYPSSSVLSYKQESTEAVFGSSNTCCLPCDQLTEQSFACHWTCRLWNF